MTPNGRQNEASRGSVFEVFLAFLRLGVSSFGGPIAHLGYFRREFVERRRWTTTTQQHSLIDALAGLYRAGALVFGGAHVVLPLLEDAVVGPGLLSADEFLAGYGAAQSIPGPMFSLSAYLGMKLAGGLGAGLFLVAMFLPGLLADAFRRRAVRPLGRPPSA